MGTIHMFMSQDKYFKGVSTDLSVEGTQEMRVRLGVHVTPGRTGRDSLTMCCGCQAQSPQWSHFMTAKLGPFLCPHAVRGTHAPRGWRGQTATHMGTGGILRCLSRFPSVLASHS